VATIKRQTRAAYGCQLQVKDRGRGPSLRPIEIHLLTYRLECRTPDVAGRKSCR